MVDMSGVTWLAPLSFEDSGASAGPASICCIVRIPLQGFWNASFPPLAHKAFGVEGIISFFLRKPTGTVGAGGVTKLKR